MDISGRGFEDYVEASSLRIFLTLKTQLGPIQHGRQPQSLWAHPASRIPGQNTLQN